MHGWYCEHCRDYHIVASPGHVGGLAFDPSKIHPGPKIRIGAGGAHVIPKQPIELPSKTGSGGALPGGAGYGQPSGQGGSYLQPGGGIYVKPSDSGGAYIQPPSQGGSYIPQPDGSGAGSQQGGYYDEPSSASTPEPFPAPQPAPDPSVVAPMAEFTPTQPAAQAPTQPAQPVPSPAQAQGMSMGTMLVAGIATSFVASLLFYALTDHSKRAYRVDAH